MVGGGWQRGGKKQKIRAVKGGTRSEPKRSALGGLEGGRFRKKKEKSLKEETFSGGRKFTPTENLGGRTHTQNKHTQQKHTQTNKNHKKTPQEKTSKDVACRLKITRGKNSLGKG